MTPWQDRNSLDFRDCRAEVVRDDAGWAAIEIGKMMPDVPSIIQSVVTHQW
jgi:hypothetical protein